MQPHRKWIDDGELTKVRSSLISFLVPVRLYLFNDLIVIAEKTVAAFRYTFQTDLMETIVEETEDDRFKHVFKISSINNSAILNCKSEEEKRYWISTINSAINDLLETKNIASQAEYKESRQQLAETLKLREIQSQGYSDYKRDRSTSDVQKKEQYPGKVPGVGFIPNEELNDNDEHHIAQIRKLSRVPTQEDLNEEEEQAKEEELAKNYELENKNKRKSDLFTKPPVNSQNNNNTTGTANSRNNYSAQKPSSSGNPYSATSKNAETTTLLTSQTKTQREGCSCGIM